MNSILMSVDFFWKALSFCALLMRFVVFCRDHILIQIFVCCWVLAYVSLSMMSISICSRRRKVMSGVFESSHQDLSIKHTAKPKYRPFVNELN